MKLYYTYIVALLLAVCSVPVAAQGTQTMKFAGDEWDFGRIREVDGPVEHTFTFTNTGNTAFVIERVTVGCGCTTPTFSKNPILPGKQGTITIKYDPRERPGVFIHDITIVSRKGRNNNTIRIRGEVIPRPRSVEDDYPFLYPGGLRFSVLTLNFGMIMQGEAKSLIVGYANTSDKPVTLAFETSGERNFLSVTAPKTVAPGARGEVTVTYDLRRTTFYGRSTDRIIPIVNGMRQDMVFSAIFTAVDSREGVDPGDSPEIVINPMFHHFGDVRRSDKLTRKVRISNGGKRPLAIRWVKTKAFLATDLRAGLELAPGESREITVSMDVSGLEDGMNTGSVSVISNDPLRPVREIRFIVNVK